MHLLPPLALVKWHSWSMLAASATYRRHQ